MPRIDKQEALARAAAERARLSQNHGGCVMCALAAGFYEDVEVLGRTEHAIAVLDRFAARRGHVVVVLRRHVESIADLSWEEWQGVQKLTFEATRALQKALSPRRIFVASLGAATARVNSFPHHHVHVIPLDADGDEERPARVFSWEHGVFVYDDREARELGDRIREAIFRGLTSRPAVTLNEIRGAKGAEEAAGAAGANVNGPPDGRSSNESECRAGKNTSDQYTSQAIPGRAAAQYIRQRTGRSGHPEEAASASSDATAVDSSATAVASGDALSSPWTTSASSASFCGQSTSAVHPNATGATAAKSSAAILSIFMNASPPKTAATSHEGKMRPSPPILRPSGTVLEPRSPDVEPRAEIDVSFVSTLWFFAPPSGYAALVRRLA